MRWATYISLLLLMACRPDADMVEQVVGKGHFRGLYIGDDRKKVEERTDPNIALTDNGSSYTYELSVAGTEMTVRYDLDEDALYAIQADIFFSDSAQLATFQEQLMARYDRLYGPVNEEGGFLVWQDNGKVEITLADESIEFGEPKLSLTIYNFEY